MKLKYFLSLSLFFLLLSFSFSEATIRYVSKSGTSQPPYTSWQTAADSIQKCINICSFGDTVYVANGVYKETVVMIPGLSLIGSDWDSTVVDTRGLLQPGYPSIWFKDSCYLKGFNIIVSDENLTGNGVYISPSLVSTSGIIEQNNIFYGIDGILSGGGQVSVNSNLINFSAYGISMDDINSSLIENNLIIPTGVGINSGVGATPFIFNNIINLQNSNSTGIDCIFSYGTRINNNLIISNNSNKGIETYAWDTLTNNNVYGYFSYAGILSYGRDFTVNNSITNGNVGYRKYSGSTDTPYFKYNNVWGNNQNYINYSPDTTNISYDPMYVNTDSMDFHLQMFSPLIDAGDPNMLDKDGSRSDIGLYGGPFGVSYKYLDLAPSPPLNLTALDDSNYITLNWNRNTEADTSFYKVYRDTVINFTIDSTKLISSSTDTFLVQINPHNVTKYVYKVTCVDNQANESKPSEEKVVIITGIENYPQLITDYQLYQNYPNPFNPTTTISYRLKERSYVKLRVYDINGELVNVLVNQVQVSGYYEVTFSMNNNDNSRSAVQNLASGIYLYKIDVISENNIPVYSQVKKMLLLK
ncbi:MAG: hypothetical protein IPH97_05900 [Ignavibacteriales bacterium]|nr:hypothetical protein [Ignavibacteriales bacterium]